jgi:hypothetical protein
MSITKQLMQSVSHITGSHRKIDAQTLADANKAASRSANTGAMQALSLHATEKVIAQQQDRYS